ncbi:hypothetical protein BO71DRAFT_487697 [Aspergillus ellipticus CBS 707.79]|uniref:Uncharacterized protein n=1 Tax=Aspergillus ellipticus CBS 707.79 TaxID=1448320 RepID=A0A319DFC4_9EURO|nr:hypothetical protein BO71DRAFT_487697 [Aspergillus ellipticus CBS 707.79]
MTPIPGKPDTRRGNCPFQNFSAYGAVRAVLHAGKKAGNLSAKALSTNGRSRRGVHSGECRRDYTPRTDHTPLGKPSCSDKITANACENSSHWGVPLDGPDDSGDRDYGPATRLSRKWAEQGQAQQCQQRALRRISALPRVRPRPASSRGPFLNALDHTVPSPYAAQDPFITGLQMALQLPPKQLELHRLPDSFRRDRLTPFTVSCSPSICHDRHDGPTLGSPRRP